MATGTSPDQQPAISAAASRRERHPGDSCGCLAGRCAVSRRFSEVEVAEVWERRHTGEPTPSIARRPGTQGSSIRGVFEDSSGVAAGDSLCVIRERPPPGTPTQPRGVARDGGRTRYRAHRVDRAAWQRARRPCRLATTCRLVAFQTLSVVVGTTRQSVDPAKLEAGSRKLSWADTRQRPWPFPSTRTRRRSPG